MWLSPSSRINRVLKANYHTSDNYPTLTIRALNDMFRTIYRNIVFCEESRGRKHIHYKKTICSE